MSTRLLLTIELHIAQSWQTFCNSEQFCELSEPNNSNVNEDVTDGAHNTFSSRGQWASKTISWNESCWNLFISFRVQDLHSGIPMEEPSWTRIVILLALPLIFDSTKAASEIIDLQNVLTHLGYYFGKEPSTGCGVVFLFPSVSKIKYLSLPRFHYHDTILINEEFNRFLKSFDCSAETIFA